MTSPAIKRWAAGLVLSAAGAAGIVSHEGWGRRVYLDPVGIPTVCAGHTSTVSVKDLGRTFSEQQCSALLAADTRQAQADVRRLVKVPMTQEQFDALVSFAFNVGGTNLASSTMLARINSGQCMEAGAEFPRWNKAKGRVLPGLVKRRAWERSLWESGCQ